MLKDGAFGAAGDTILVEEFMEGEELSVFAMTDGERVVVLPAAQDHKRLLERDRGPNTGGMGAYCPVSLVEQMPGLIDEIVDRIIRPTLSAMRASGTPFTGLLYVGAMLTADGPKVVEFNCRFGDPETQAVLPAMSLEDSMADAMFTIARGDKLSGDSQFAASRAAVTTVLAAPGYPESPRIGAVDWLSANATRRPRLSRRDETARRWFVGHRRRPRARGHRCWRDRSTRRSREVRSLRARSSSRESNSAPTLDGASSNGVPELPETETIARDLDREVAGARIVSVAVTRPDVLREVTARAFVATCVGRIDRSKLAPREARRHRSDDRRPSRRAAALHRRTSHRSRRSAGARAPLFHDRADIGRRPRAALPRHSSSRNGRVDVRRTVHANTPPRSESSLLTQASRARIYRVFFGRRGRQSKKC